MHAILGRKANEELNRLISPIQQNKILFGMMLLLIVFGIFYVLSFYF